MSLARISKAIAGGLASGVSTLVAVWPDGVTPQEWGTVAGAVVVGFLGVFIAPKNSLTRQEISEIKAAPMPPVESTSGPGRG